MSPEDDFLARLEFHLRRRGVRARDVAARAGLNEGTLSKWRNRQEPANPTLKTLARLAQALGTDIASLVSDPSASAESEEIRAEREALHRERERLLADAERIAVELRRLSPRPANEGLRIRE